MKGKLTVLPLLLVLLFLFYGCTGVSDANGKVKFNADGSGSGQFTYSTSSTYADQVADEIRSGFGSKKNFRLTSSSGYNYVASFDFDTPTGITAYSRFEKTSETGWSVVYRYTDQISLDTITGKTNSQGLPFTYCVQMPAGTTVKRFVVDGTEQTPSTNPCTYLLTGASKSIIVESGVEFNCNLPGDLCSSNQNCINGQCVLKSGCIYNNPACDDRHDCISNDCVLKKGCQYDNPSCDENHNCINNQCVLKPGCQYNNPPCGNRYDCISNSCVLKKGCDYENPSCDSNHICIKNACILKDGCKYHNPDCSGFMETCYVGENKCGFDFCNVMRVVTLVLGIGIFLVIIRLWKDWHGSGKDFAIAIMVMVLVVLFVTVITSNQCRTIDDAVCTSGAYPCAGQCWINNCAANQAMACKADGAVCEDVNTVVQPSDNSGTNVQPLDNPIICDGRRLCLGQCWNDCPSDQVWNCEASGGVCNPRCSSGQLWCAGQCWYGCASNQVMKCGPKGGVCVDPNDPYSQIYGSTVQLNPSLSFVVEKYAEYNTGGGTKSATLTFTLTNSGTERDSTGYALFLTDSQGRNFEASWSCSTSLNPGLTKRIECPFTEIPLSATIVSLRTGNSMFDKGNHKLLLQMLDG